MEENYQYNLAVLNNIDSALKTDEYKEYIFTDEQLRFGYLAPQGIFVEYINDIAWEVAKNNNISSRLDFETVSQLTEIYDQQIMIEKGYEMVGEILNSSVSLQTDKANETLYLIRGAYKGWAVDRMPVLLGMYDRALDSLEKY